MSGSSAERMEIMVTANTTRMMLYGEKSLPGVLFKAVLDFHDVREKRWLSCAVFRHLHLRHSSYPLSGRLSAAHPVRGPSRRRTPTYPTPRRGRSRSAPRLS